MHLEPGASARVSLTLDARAFSFWHTPAAPRVVEGGTFGIRVGASSRDVRLTAVVHLTGDDLSTPLTPDSPVSAWLDHPVAGPRLLARLGTGEMADMLVDQQHGAMMRAIPLVRLARFPGFPIPERDLPTLAAEANAPTA